MPCPSKRDPPPQHTPQSLLHTATRTQGYKRGWWWRGEQSLAPPTSHKEGGLMTASQHNTQGGLTTISLTKTRLVRHTAVSQQRVCCCDGRATSCSAPEHRTLTQARTALAPNTQAGHSVATSQPPQGDVRTDNADKATATDAGEQPQRPDGAGAQAQAAQAHHPTAVPARALHSLTAAAGAARPCRAAGPA